MFAIFIMCCMYCHRRKPWKSAAGESCRDAIQTSKSILSECLWWRTNWGRRPSHGSPYFQRRHRQSMYTWNFCRFLQSNLHVETWSLGFLCRQFYDFQGLSSVVTGTINCTYLYLHTWVGLLLIRVFINKLLLTTKSIKRLSCGILPVTVGFRR